MPRTTITTIEPEPIGSTLCEKIRIKLYDASEFDWDLFTLSVSLLFALIGMCCCVIQVVSIVQSHMLACYGVGLWTSAGFTLTGILAICLYLEDQVAPVTWMVASVICDLLCGVALASIGCGLSLHCIEQSSIFVGVTMSCISGIVMAIFHAFMFIREIGKLRFQLIRTKSTELSEGSFEKDDHQIPTM